MKIVNPAYLKSCHSPGRCESCGRMCREREPHHVQARGSGRIDDPYNIVCLGHTGSNQCHCHSLMQEGKANQKRFLGIIAKREKVAEEDVVAVIFFVKQLHQRDSVTQIEVKMLSLCPMVREMVIQVLKRAGRL